MQGSSPDPNHRACRPRLALKLERNLLAGDQVTSSLCHEDPAPNRTTATCKERLVAVFCLVALPAHILIACVYMYIYISLSLSLSLSLCFSVCMRIYIYIYFYHIFTKWSCKGAFQQQGTGGQGALFATAAEVISKMATWSHALSTPQWKWQLFR